jgi:hypothetical protein
MPEQTEKSPSELLAEALEHLDPADRQRVTAWCLARMSGSSYFGWLGRGGRERPLWNLTTGGQEAAEAFAHASASLSGSMSGTGHQVVPVRLPADLHARLRLWSTEHGFSMATVVRGLVARFLDGQTAPPE